MGHLKNKQTYIRAVLDQINVYLASKVLWTEYGFDPLGAAHRFQFLVKQTAVVLLHRNIFGYSRGLCLSHKLKPQVLQNSKNSNSRASNVAAQDWKELARKHTRTKRLKSALIDPFWSDCEGVMLS